MSKVMRGSIIPDFDDHAMEVPFGVFAVSGEGGGLAQAGPCARRSEPVWLQLRHQRDRLPTPGAVLGATDSGLRGEPDAEEQERQERERPDAG